MNPPLTSIPQLPSLSPANLPTFRPVSELISDLLSSDFIEDAKEEAKRAQSQAEKRALQIIAAVKASQSGRSLIKFTEVTHVRLHASAQLLTYRPHKAS